ncbi:MAG: hypothetical protein K2X03_13805 [Bryobacteraceae bacterium]|nr:hypothetical protein [Bryobacteraceae bacterium]
MKFRLLVLALAASALFAADVTGKWVAKMQTPNGDTRDMVMKLKADGDKLTGTVGGMRGDAEITDGKIAGDDVSWVVVRNFNGNEMRQEYKGKVSGAEMKLTVSFGERTMEMTAKKSE